MDDVPDQTCPSVIADAGSKAGTAAIGLACLRWTKEAVAHSRGAPVKRYVPPAALTAGLFGLACLGWSNIQTSRADPAVGRDQSSGAENSRKSHAQRAEVEAIHAAQSLNTKEVSAPQPAKPSLEARTKPALALSRPRARPTAYRPNPWRSLPTEATGSIELD